MYDNGNKEAGTLLPTVFDYRGKKVAFELHDGSVMLNATEMGKAFGKRPKDWLRTDQAKEFIAAVVRHQWADMPTGSESITYNSVVKVQNGGDHQGTWLHEDVALEYARWLSPDFAIWTNRHIKQLMMTGYTVREDVAKQIVADGSFHEGQVFMNKMGTSTVHGAFLDGQLWFGLSGIMDFMGYTKNTAKPYAIRLQPNSRMHKVGNREMWLINFDGMEALLAMSQTKLNSDQLTALYRDLYRTVAPGRSLLELKYEFCMSRKQMTDIIKELMRGPVNKNRVVSMLMDTEIA